MKVIIQKRGDYTKPEELKRLVSSFIEAVTGKPDASPELSTRRVKDITQVSIVFNSPERDAREVEGLIKDHFPEMRTSVASGTIYAYHL